MKRVIALLACLLIAAAPVAPAESMPGFEFIDPFEDREPEPTPLPQPTAEGQDIQIEIDGQRVSLGFDDNPDYSSVQDGMVQASFYSYGDDKVTLYELYMIFPESAQAGMIITPDYAALIGAECSVALIVSDNSGETYYYSGLLNGAVYPEGSTFSISIESADGGSFAGQLSGTLVALDPATGTVADTLRLTDAPFRFTMPADAEQRHADPLPTALPKDMRKV